MKRILLSILLLSISCSLAAQDSFSSLEERMTGKEFMETGLSKLTDVELKALNDWLRAHSVATLEAPARSTTAPITAAAATTGSSTQSAASEPGDRRGFEFKDADSDDIHSRIIGEFTGWTGETVFELENGMIWKQAQTDKFFTKALTNPGVRIKTTMFGGWRMQVEGYNKWVKVERIQ